MKYLKIFEEFTDFQLDEISKQEYYSILDNNRLVYIPESEVLEFKKNLSKEYKLIYARASVKDTVEWFRAEYETEIQKLYDFVYSKLEPCLNKQSIYHPMITGLINDIPYLKNKISQQFPDIIDSIDWGLT